MATTKPKSTKIVIVRSQLAGVRCGELVSVDGTTYILREATQIWRWRGANTIIDLAREGASMSDYTRISQRSPGTVTIHDVFDAVEVVDPKVADNLRSARWFS